MILLSMLTFGLSLELNLVLNMMLIFFAISVFLLLGFIEIRLWKFLTKSAGKFSFSRKLKEWCKNNWPSDLVLISGFGFWFLYFLLLLYFLNHCKPPDIQTRTPCVYFFDLMFFNFSIEVTPPEIWHKGGIKWLSLLVYLLKMFLGLTLFLLFLNFFAKRVLKWENVSLYLGCLWVNLTLLSLWLFF